MTAVWKPTQDECDLIRQAAEREADARAIKLFPGMRWNTERETSPTEVNIALVSSDPDWADTDLAEYGTWRDFRRGVTLTEDRRAIVDFYIRGRNEDLLGNVSVDYAGGKIVRIYGYSGLRDYPVTTS